MLARLDKVGPVRPGLFEASQRVSTMAAPARGGALRDVLAPHVWAPRAARTSDWAAHHSDVLANAFRRVAGLAVSREALVKLYSGILPGTQVLFTPSTTFPLIRPEDETRLALYELWWFDERGKYLFCATRALERHPDGSLELHWIWSQVEESVRGKGLSAKIMEVEIDLLRKLSAHEKTRIALRAGDESGFFVWATYGFQFADQHGLRHHVVGQDPRVPNDPGFEAATDLELMVSGFSRWLDEQRQLSSEQREAMRRASSSWRTPHDVARFDVPGLTFKTESFPMPVPAGKAFMFSKHSPSWDGVFFVNQRDGEAMQVFEANFRRYDAEPRAAGEISTDAWPRTFYRNACSSELDALPRAYYWLYWCMTQGRTDMELLGRLLRSRNKYLPAYAVIALKQLELQRNPAIVEDYALAVLASGLKDRDLRRQLRNIVKAARAVMACTPHRTRHPPAVSR
jgi:hypothetical protein